jgi:cardiolipin synthase
MALLILSLIIAATLIIFLLQPGPRYKLAKIPSQPLDSDEFAHLLETMVDAKLRQENSIEVLPNGENYYPAELEAIRSAQRNINMEAYIFQKGEVSQQFVDALAERARAGVAVHLTIDWLGSLAASKKYFQPLLAAGGKVEWYHPLRWDTWPRINNRTHRELLIVDGTVGFIGGAGITRNSGSSPSVRRGYRSSMERPPIPAQFVCRAVAEAAGQSGRSYRSDRRRIEGGRILAGPG